MDKDNQLFFSLLREGIWADVNNNHNVDDNLFRGVNWSVVYQLAQEQSVQGLVLQGLERFKNHNDNPNLNVNIPQVLLLQWIGEVQMIEKRNKAMNQFVAELVEKMRAADIYAILVKGQGVAQCYERPIWRTSGDIDLLLSVENYEKAKSFLVPLASSGEKEILWKKHLGLTVDGWKVELHGRLHCGLSSKIERELFDVQYDAFYGGQVRSWTNGGTQVFLLKEENDVFYVFTHILQHFFKGGIGLRQISDWCRLLWTYRKSMNYGLLEQRIKRAGLMSEWKAFAAFSVEYLGMQVEEMPLFKANDNSNTNLKRKADKICNFVLEVGNFGHNRDLRAKGCKAKSHEVFFWRKFKSFWGLLSDMMRHIRLFPLDSIRFFCGIIRSGLHSAVRGE